jgi:hypothetical protein
VKGTTLEERIKARRAGGEKKPAPLFRQHVGRTALISRINERINAGKKKPVVKKKE